MSKSLYFAHAAGMCWVNLDLVRTIETCTAGNGGAIVTINYIDGEEAYDVGPNTLGKIHDHLLYINRKSYEKN